MQQVNSVCTKTIKAPPSKVYLFLCIVLSASTLIATNLLSPTNTKLVSNFYFITFSLSVVFFSIMVLRKHDLHSNDGKLVLLFTVFAIFRSCAEITWIIQESVLFIDPFPSVADLFWFASYGVFFGFFAMYVRPIKKSIPKNIHVLALILSCSFLIPSIIATASLQDETNRTEMLIALMYPILDSILLYYAILCLVYLHNGRKNEFLFLLLLSIIGIVISDTFFVTLSANYQNGSMNDLGWIVGYVFLSFAILNFKSISKEQSYQNFFNVDGKNIASPIRFETIVRFVIPFVVVIMALVSIMVMINDQYLDGLFDNDDNVSFDSYITLGLLISVSIVILFINHKLFYLVRNKTVELQSERDLLQLQIKEKNDIIQKSKILEKNLDENVKTLITSEQKYRNLYDGSNDLYCTIDTKGVIIDCNPSFAHNLNLTKEQLIGNIFFGYLAQKSIYDMNMIFATWINSGTTVDREIWLERVDGTSFPTLLRMSNLYNVDGDLVGCNMTMKDITMQKTISDKLENTLADLQKTSNLKDEFLAMVSHELKTPLVPIIGYCDILYKEKLGLMNEEQKKRLQVVYSSALRLRRLINDLLDAQKLALGQLSLRKQPHDMKNVVQDALEDYLLSMEQRHITAKLDEKNKTICFCDKERIQQVLTNLLRNSIDFCPDTGGRIIIHLSSDDKTAKIIVTDNGKGISKEKIEKLFVKFYQIDASTTREHGGSGLGLSICRGIIEEHGGRIWAESEGEGKGTQIYIEMPLKS